MSGDAFHTYAVYIVYGRAKSRYADEIGGARFKLERKLGECRVFKRDVAV